MPYVQRIEENIGDEGRYRAVVVTVTVSVIVTGPLPPSGIDVMLESLAVGADVGAGGGAAGG